jgi:branched-chain amino acid transport system substrate-binding protein
MSGPLAEAGKAMAAGAAQAVRDLNTRGGLNGAKLEIVIENDDAGTAPARKIAEAMAARNIRHVVGHYTSAPTLTASEIYQKQKMLLIAPTATAPRLTERMDAPVLRLAPREDAQGSYAGALLARDFPSGEIVIVRDGSAASRILTAAAQRAMEAAGRGSAKEIEITAGAPDGAALAADQANTLLRTNTVAIYWAGGASNVAAFLRALHAGQSRSLFIGNDALATPEFAAAAGELANGVRVTVLGNRQHGGPREVSAPLVARLKAEGIRDIDLALSTYAAFQVLQQASVRARSLDPMALTTAARDGRPFSTVVGPVSFNTNGDRIENQFTLAVWKPAADGKFVFAPM